MFLVGPEGAEVFLVGFRLWHSGWFYWKQILVALKELVGQVEQNLVGLDGVDPKLVGPKEVESIQSCMEAGRSGARLVGFWRVVLEQGWSVFSWSF